MQPLNAIDAITPAFNRTHELLFKPFKLGRSWKLAATSYVAFAGNFFFPLPLLFFFPFFLPHNTPFSNPLLIAIGIIPTLIYFVLFYCFVRLQLVDFEMLLTTAKMIAPMWRRYSSKVWPWIAAKIVMSLAAYTLMAPLLIHSFRNFFAVVSQMPKPGEKADPAAVEQMFSSIIGFYGVMILLFFVPKTFATLIDDFVLPFFLLEDLPFFLALRRGIAVFLAEPLACIGYLFMKFVLGILGYIMQSIAAQICMIPLVIVGVILVTVGTLVSAHSGAGFTVLLVTAGVILGIAFLVAITYVTIGMFGYMLLLLDAYAQYFLGGRYPLLGNLLEPGPNPPFTPPPVFPSPEEQDDHDGGPPMPMNPALA